MILIGYIALYRRYRPKTFLEVVGQEHITKTLKNQVASNRVAHAYLFNGPRGTGKTSTAKILSRAINCLNPKDGEPCNECEVCTGILDGSIMDVSEIDAASNNSVDNVRDIREEVVYTPAKTKYKVYIIDEVHMLSTGAFNALLKTLEEPPSHVVFILATTEPHKLPATIISRCQRFDFKKIPSDVVFSRLKEVVGDVGAEAEDKALELIAHLSEGGMRDALSILDQSLSLANRKVTHDDILSIVGIVDTDILFDLSDSIKEKDTSSAIKIIDKVSKEGKDIGYFIVRLLSHFRNILMAKVLKSLDSIVDLSEENIERLKKTSEVYSQGEIINIINILSDTMNDAKRSAYPKILLETAVVKLCNTATEQGYSDLVDRINKIERALRDGVKVTSQPQKKEIVEVKSKEEKIIDEPKHEIKDATSESIAKEISKSWKSIIEDMKAKGFSPLKVQFLNNIAIKPFNDKVVMGHLEYKEDIIAKMIEEKHLVNELKDSMFKITGKEIDIRFDSKKLEKEPPTLDNFKEMVAQRGMGGLINEV